MYSAFDHWAYWSHMLTVISMFSPYTQWVFGPLSPVRSTTVTGNAKRRCVTIRVARVTPTDPVDPRNLPALLLRPLPLPLLLLPHLLLRRPGLRKTRTSPLPPPSPSRPAPTLTLPAGSPPRSANVGWTISSVCTAGRKGTELRTVP